MKFRFALILALFALVLFGFGFSNAVSADEPFARAIAVEGDASVQKGGTGNWAPMTDGMALDKKDVVQTRHASRVDISYDKELANVMRVLENSTVTLKDGSEIEVPKGRILAKLDGLKPGSSFNARTPDAICGVRGSGFGVQTDGKNTQAYAYEDNCYVTSLDAAGNPIGATLTLPEGYKSFVGQGLAPGVSVLLSNAESDEYQQFVKDINALINGVASVNNPSPSISPSGSR